VYHLGQKKRYINTVPFLSFRPNACHTPLCLLLTVVVYFVNVDIAESALLGASCADSNPINATRRAA